MAFRSLTEQDPPNGPGSAHCGGTLISEKIIVTAAHCFDNVTLSDLQNYFVVLGSQFINDTNPVRYRFRSLTLHPRYNPGTFENDIAIVEIDRPADFNDSRVGFICLPPRNNSLFPPGGTFSVAAGWGLLEQGGDAPYQLQQVLLPIVPPETQTCADLINDGIIQFCAGVPEGGKDTCQGDR